MARKGTLFIVSAPSGAGKTSLIKALLERFNYDNSMRLSISHTTRQPRPAEENHVSYHFVSVDEFQELIERNAFYEYAKVFDNYYGTSKEIVQEQINQGYDVFLDIDWQGARIIKEQSPDAIGIFILPPSIEELKNRLISRGQDDESVIEHRMDKALREISHYSEYDYVIVNDNFDVALNQLRSIVLSHRSTLAKAQEGYDALLSSFKFKESQ